MHLLLAMITKYNMYIEYVVCMVTLTVDGLPHYLDGYPNVFLVSLVCKYK